MKAAVAKKIEKQKTSTREEDSLREQFFETFKNCPIPEDEFLSNLGLFISSRNLSRILLMDFLFRQIREIHGVVMEFGLRWGQNLALFSTLRAIYEPFNRHRQVIGFDTFEGALGVSNKDGNSNWLKPGALKVTQGYEEYLKEVMEFHEQENPVSQFRKFSIRKGDAAVELKKYLEEHPESIVSLAFFDLGLYKPTRECLEILKEHLTKGSVIAFDELNEPEAPGETLAVKDAFGLSQYCIRRYPYASRVSYIVIE